MTQTVRFSNPFTLLLGAVLFSSYTALAAVPDTLGWYEIPDTKLEPLNPALDPTVNPEYPDKTTWHGPTGRFAGLIQAWNSGAYDTKRDRLYIWGGGHGDYYGNELYAFDLNDLSVSRLTNPAYPIATSCVRELSPNNGTQPNARHTYDGIVYMPSVDRVFSFSGSLACGTGSSGNDVWWFDPNTNTWERKYPTGDNPASGDTLSVMTAWDSINNRVYLHTRTGGLFVYDPTVGTEGEFTKLSTESLSKFHYTMGFDPENNILLASNGSNGSFYWWDVGNGSYSKQTLSATGDSVLKSTYQAPGLVFDPVLKKIIGWNGGTTVYALDWNAKRWDPIVSAGPTPSTPQTRGTYGRFAYSPARNRYVLINSVDTNVFTLKLSAGGGSAPPTDADADWATRSTAPGVVYSNRFDNFDTDFYANLWPKPELDRRASAYDTTIKASGAGSARFDFVPGGEGFGGELAVSLGDDPSKQFGAGDDMWVQWRQRFDPYVIDHQYAVTQGSGMWKQLIISQGQLPGQSRWDTRSCSENQIVVVNASGKKYPQSYHGCWVYYGLNSVTSNGAISKMNLGDEDGAPNPPRREETWPCQYWPQGSDESGCRYYKPDQWMTFMVHVKFGPAGESNSSISNGPTDKGFVNSTYELYFAEEGQPLELVNRITGVVFRRGNYDDDPNYSSHQAKYGMFRWLPLISFKDASENHQVASTWIDELIISRSRIPDPGANAATPRINFSSSASSVVEGNPVSLTWSSADAVSCSASGAWSGTKPTSGSETSATLTTTSSFTLSCDDAQGNTNSRTVTVQVTPPPLPSVSLNASATYIANGGSARLSWSSSDATTCSASGAWSGTKTTSGSESIGPLAANSSHSFTLTCSGAGGERSDTLIVRTVADPGSQYLPRQEFSSDGLGTDPAGWTDTGANNSMSEDDRLFKIYSIDGDNVFGTTNTSATNIHSHYTGAGSDSWNNYRYSGRMRIGSASDNIGVTFYSDYPNSDRYYRLRRETGTSFHISPHGTQCSGTTDSGVIPDANRWYHFLIETENSASATTVRAKIWPGDGIEPADWQISCSDAGASRLTGGTVGLWAVVGGNDSGGKYWDDLKVSPLTATPPPTDTDSDGDGLIDSWEQTHFGNLNSSGSDDSDNDGLSNLQEQSLNLNPTASDSDGDGASDGEEVRYGSNPADSSDNWQNHRPAQPDIAAIGTAVLRGQRFDANGYSDPDGDRLGSAQWQISQDSGFSQHVLDRRLGGRTDLTIPLGILQGSRDYWVRTRHYDNTGLPSKWSAGRQIRTEARFAEDLDGNGSDDRYQVTGYADSNGNSINDAEEGGCNLRDAENGNRIGFRAGTGKLHCLTSHAAAELSAVAQSGKTLPYGLFTVVIDGLTSSDATPASVDLTLYFPQRITAAYSYDGISDSLDSFGGAVSINGSAATLTFTDGSADDLDGVVNGVIVNTVGVATANPNDSSDSPAPSSSGGGGVWGWGTWLLILFAALRRLYQGHPQSGRVQES